MHHHIINQHAKNIITQYFVSYYISYLDSMNNNNNNNIINSKTKQYIVQYNSIDTDPKPSKKTYWSS